MKVLKFGGKSLDSKEKILGVCKHIKELSANTKLVVVVSAIGDTTNRLLNLCKEYDVSATNLREIDAIVSTGETQSAAILSLVLNSENVKAISMQGWQIDIRTLGQHSQSIITGINKNKILSKFDYYDVVVVAGFQGINSDGDVTTLGRGGSDTTAVALGTVLNCEVEIYSDFDGVCVGDPKELNFKKLKDIDYIGMQMLANEGSKVLSAASIDIARQAKVKVCCKQSSCPNKLGTHLSNVPTPFVGVTCINDLCEINIVSNSTENNLKKTAKFILNSVNFYKICVKNNKITLLIDKNAKKDILQKIAKFNDLLE